MHLNHRVANPQLQRNIAFPTIVPHELYHNHKIERKQVQNKRKNVEQGVSFLERQAKKSTKDLQWQQNTLLSYYMQKEDRFETSQKKQEWVMKNEFELNNLRKTNTQLRNTSTSRRQSARNDVLQRNRQSAQKIKQSHSSLEKELSAERQLEKQLLHKRNQAFSKAKVLGNKYSKAKSFYDNRCKSGIVKHQLITIEDAVKAKEINKISHLSKKQAELLSIVEKSKKEKMHYESALNNMKTMKFNEFYTDLVDTQLLGKHRRLSKNRIKSLEKFTFSKR